MLATQATPLQQAIGRVAVYRMQFDAATRSHVLETVELWERFIQLPLETKKLIHYQPDMRLSGFGYEYKEGKNGTDRKEDIHLQLVNQKALRRMARATGERVAIDFVASGLELITDVRPLVTEFVEELCEAHGIADFSDDVTGSISNWLLRFLHYFPGGVPGHPIARLHTDKGCFTPHLYESHPGLQWLNSDGVWKDVNLSHDETVVLPGIRLQHRMKCEVAAVCHQVVATEETAIEGRTSVVCFIDSFWKRCFDKTLFGSQQEWQGEMPGRNYSMTFEQLDSFFCDM